MLKLARGICFGMYIGYLLQLQRPFKRKRIVYVAAHKEYVPLHIAFGGEGLKPGLILKQLFYYGRQLRQGRYKLPFKPFVNMAAHAPKVYGQKLHQHELGGICLCRGDGYLGPGPGV